MRRDRVLGTQLAGVPGVDEVVELRKEIAKIAEITKN